MKPLLAHVYEPHRVTFPCYVQPKLNGIRALYQNGNFQSRDELPFPQGLLDHLAGPLKQLFDPKVILDGELYKHGWPLQRINGAVTPVRQEPNEDTLQVEYHVFDAVNYQEPFASFDNFIVIRKPMGGTTTKYQGALDRFSTILEVASQMITNVVPVFTIPVFDQTEADEWYAKFISQGYEGMMYRLGDCPYTVPKQLNEKWVSWNEGVGWTKPRTKFLSDQDNRCWHLLKRKDWQDNEFTCVDVVEGEGKLQGMLGAVICQTKSNNRFNIGSGLTDSERQHYWANPPIGKKIKVKYLVLSNDGIPLNPTILAIL